MGFLLEILEAKRKVKKKQLQPGKVAPIYKSSIQKAKAEKSPGVKGQPGLQCETLSQNKAKYWNPSPYIL